MKRPTQNFKSTQSWRGWSKSRKYPTRKVPAPNKEKKPSPDDERMKESLDAMKESIHTLMLGIGCVLAAIFLGYVFIYEPIANNDRAKLAAYAIIAYCWFLVYLFAKFSGGGSTNERNPFDGRDI